MRQATLFIFCIVVALIAVAQAKGGNPSFDRSSSKGRAGLGFDRSSSKTRAGLGFDRSSSKARAGLGFDRSSSKTRAGLGFDRSSSKSRAGLGYDRSSSKSKSGLGVSKPVRRPVSRPVSKPVQKPRQVRRPTTSTPRPIRRPFSPKISSEEDHEHAAKLRLKNFIARRARKFSGPTRACLYSCKTSRGGAKGIFACARACFTKACLRRIPSIVFKCDHNCGKLYSRRKCKKVCGKIAQKLFEKCKFQ